MLSALMNLNNVMSAKSEEKPMFSQAIGHFLWVEQ